MLVVRLPLPPWAWAEYRHSWVGEVIAMEAAIENGILTKDELCGLTPELVIEVYL